MKVAQQSAIERFMVIVRELALWPLRVIIFDSRDVRLHVQRNGEIGLHTLTAQQIRPDRSSGWSPDLMINYLHNLLLGEFVRSLLFPAVPKSAGKPKDQVPIF
jgi:hypothetical protein